MQMGSQRGRLGGVRIACAAMVALVGVMVAAPAAEAAKKPPIDPSTFATSFLGSLNSFFSTLSSNADALAEQMADDVDAAIANGNIKQLLKLDSRYDKLITKGLKSYEKYAAKGLKQVDKVFKKITADPTISAQITSAIDAAMAQLDSTEFDLRNHLSTLIDQAIDEIEAEVDDNPSGDDDGTPDQGSGDA